MDCEALGIAGAKLRRVNSSATAAVMGDNPDPVSVQFGRNLRRLRSVAGMSQAALGERLDLSHQQIQKYESGANSVNVPALCRLKTILGCEFADLFAGLDGGKGGAGAGADAEEQRIIYRLSRAVQAIEGRNRRERLVDLAQAMADRS